MSEKGGNMLGVWVKDHLMISLIEIEFAKDFSPTEVVYHYSVPSSIAVANPRRDVLSSTTRNSESTEQHLDSTRALNLPSTKRGLDE